MTTVHVKMRRKNKIKTKNDVLTQALKNDTHVGVAYRGSGLFGETQDGGLHFGQ